MSAAKAGPRSEETAAADFVVVAAVAPRCCCCCFAAIVVVALGGNHTASVPQAHRGADEGSGSIFFYRGAWGGERVKRERKVEQVFKKK